MREAIISNLLVTCAEWYKQSILKISYTHILRQAGRQLSEGHIIGREMRLSFEGSAAKSNKTLDGRRQQMNFQLASVAGDCQRHPRSFQM